ncbi:MAG: DMT family transporter [Patescibacteria group bacterium]
MVWLFIIILAYFFFSIASLGDKLVLSRAQSPRLYTFYVGVLSLIVLVLTPFADFRIPVPYNLFWIILTSFVLITGMYALYSAVNKFDVSRVVPVIGAVQPLFILILSWLFWGAQVIKANSLFAFAILLLGGIIISFEKKPRLTKELLKISFLASFLTALSFILFKIVFQREPFLRAIIWIGIFNFIFVLFFLFYKSFRREIFEKKAAFSKKTLTLVVLTQSAGGLASLLQNFAIYLAPVSSLAIINALRGIQYVFLFMITSALSLFLPKVLKEKISKKIIRQKSVAILIIISGLIILVYS